ncbi:GNAT family N-acetyltransferase [Deinococcus aerolatus]|uniref:GNAT family N-acetyltransferase n=1 Tax=Deinococcus aerolatus TaxID=522487 RepID=UPI00166513D6|nr:GNAT family N-acetyltransferase [Deinococcus aerolatus]
MLSIEQVQSPQQRVNALGLFRKYLEWNEGELDRQYGIKWDIQATLEHDRVSLGQFLPPQGRLLLASLENMPIGVLSMKVHSDGAVELKRMYVRPTHRGVGVGRALVARAIEEARQDGRTLIRLDSAGYMHEAHRLYRRLGFRNTDSYAESEIPEPLRRHWVFMELPLNAENSSTR